MLKTVFEKYGFWKGEDGRDQPMKFIFWPWQIIVQIIGTAAAWRNGERGFKNWSLSGWESTTHVKFNRGPYPCVE